MAGQNPLSPSTIIPLPAFWANAYSNISTEAYSVSHIESYRSFIDVSFVAALAFAQLCEVYFIILPALKQVTLAGYQQLKGLPELFSSQTSNFLTVVRDFSSGRYYLPWRDDAKSHVFVSSKRHITELSDAPELSQRAVYADVFGFEITLANLSHNEQKASRYRLYGRILKIVGHEQLGILYPTIENHVDRCVRDEIAKGYQIRDGWQSVKLAPLVRSVNVEIMLYIFFGPKLSQDAEFRRAICQHPQDLVKSLIGFKIVPRFMRKPVHSLMTNGGEALDTCMRRLIPIMRRDEGAWDEDPKAKELTLLHHLLEYTKDNDYWTPLSLSQAMLGVWLAAAFQPWMNLHFIILELCSRPEWMEAIRHEIDSAPNVEYKTIESLPLLDSFMKEVFRTKPLDNYVIRRKALRPFTFSDGLPVPVGKIACVSTRQMMNDASKYPEPSRFVADRFLEDSSRDASNLQARSSAVNTGCGPGTRLTDISENFPIWGYGSLACPGRFHASFAMKVVVTHLLRNHEFKRADNKAAAAWCWEHFTIPVEKTRLLFRRRGE